MQAHQLKQIMTRQTKRWEWQLIDFCHALDQLKCFIDKGNDMNHMEAQGMIQGFQYTYEMAWKTMKHYHESFGGPRLQSPRDAFMFAVQHGIIDDETCWFDMQSDRNKTVHTYNMNTANKVAHSIRHRYYAVFIRFRTNIVALSNKLQPAFNNN